MKTIIGKILFVWFLVFINYANANVVNATVSSTSIYKGQSVQLTLSSNSNDTIFPNIIDVAGNPISSISNSSSTSYINGTKTQKISKVYTFSPKNTLDIPSYSLQVNGKSYSTQKIRITIVAPSKSTNGDDFMLEAKIENDHLKVGQSTKFTVKVMQKSGATADKFQMDDLVIENFWIEKIDGVKKYISGNYTIQEISYLVFAQKAGDFHVESIVAKIGRQEKNFRGSFFFAPALQWTQIYSNDINIHVEALPNDVELYGDFSMSASIDKSSTYANKPINLTIKINGIGNIEDIEQFEINIPNVVTYSDKPEIKSSITNDKFGGTFSQKIVLIANQDFEISPLTLQYFDSTTQQIKTIKTKKISIKVNGSSSIDTSKPVVANNHKYKVPSNVAKIEDKNTTNAKKVVLNVDYSKYYYIFSIVFFVILFSYLILKKMIFTNKNNYKSPIIGHIKKAKNDKELFDILLPYAKRYPEISDILNALEQNIYKSAKNKIEKQKLYDVFMDTAL